MVLATTSWNSAEDLEETIARTLCQHPSLTLPGVMRKADIDPAYLEAVRNTIYYMILRRRCCVNMQALDSSDAFSDEEVPHFRLSNLIIERLTLLLKSR